MGPLVTTAPFGALMSRGDSLLREAPSFMSSWMSLRHNVSISYHRPVIWARSLRLIWIPSTYERLLCLYYEAAHLLSKLWKTQHVWSCQLHSGWLISHPWPKEVAMISFIFSRFLRTDLLMLVLPVFLISFNNDNGSKTAKGISFLISSAMISFIYSRFLRTDLLMLNLPVLLISFNNEMAVKLRKEFLSW